MKKPYRYQKTLPQDEQETLRGKIAKLKNKKVLGGLLFFLGGGILLYLFSFYLSYGISLFNQHPAAKLLLGAKNTDQASQVLAITNVGKAQDHFYLSIPALKIEHSLVTANVASDKKEAYLPILSESIAHYKGTSLPGEDGDVFLYGHSVLPQFFNNKDYLTIFSTLYTIKEGDKVILDYGGTKYTYQVFGKAVIDTKDVDVVNTSGSGMKTLTLMTCTPPGTYLKRLLVQASLVN